MVSTNTRIFLRGLKLCRESRTSQVLLVSKMKIGGNHAFFGGNKASIWKKRHTLLCILLLFRIIVAYQFLKNVWLPPIFFLDSNSRCQDLLFSRSHKPRKNTSVLVGTVLKH